jgi:ABC-type phosphate/phosphonate transport system substrate-binding protein
VRTWHKLYDPQLSLLPDPGRIYPGQRFELVTDAGRRYLRLLGGTARLAAAPARSAAVPAPAPAPTPAPAKAPATAAAPAAEPEPLVIGVLPNIGAAALMTQYENMKNYLEKLGPQKVRIVLPANFKAFFESTMRGEYDLAVAAPHFARVAQQDARLVPLAMYEPRINAQFITTLDSTVATRADLRGKALAFANPQSLVAMYGQQWLRQQGLEAGKDYEVKAARTDMGVGRMLLSGDVVAAIMSNGEFRSLPADESARLKIVEVFARIPNFIILGHPRLGAERLKSLKSQLLALPADKDDGAAFMKATGLSGIVDADDATLRELEPYAAPTRRLMGTGP